MQEYFEIYLLIVVVIAFVAGYWIVSFIIKKLTDLNKRPPLNEELWRAQEEEDKQKGLERRSVNDDDEQLGIEESSEHKKNGSPK